MSVASSHALSIDALPGWNLLFAKEPAAASDPNQQDMDKTVVLGPPGKKGPTPPSGKERILFVLLVLVIAGGGGYLAVNPEMLASLLGDAPGEAPPPQLTLRVTKPGGPVKAQVPVQPAIPGTVPAPATAPAPASVAPAVPLPAPSAPTATAPKPATPPTPVPAVVASAPAPAANAPKLATPAPAAVAGSPAPAPVPAPVPAAIPASAPKPGASAAPALSTPKFSEGEKVSVSVSAPLTPDSAGKKPGTATAAPGSTLVVLDTDLQQMAWVYSVRTEQGATGWVAEKHLVAK